MTVADCGECRVHDDCGEGEKCVHKLGADGAPSNICVSPCSPDHCGENGSCLTGKCECHHGWQGPDCSERAPCVERCMNGGAELCTDVNNDDNFNCTCPNEYTGQYCENQSQCHPGY